MEEGVFLKPKLLRFKGPLGPEWNRATVIIIAFTYDEIVCFSQNKYYKIIDRCCFEVGTQQKQYVFSVDGEEKKKSKGVKKNVTKTLKLDEFKRCLL